MDNGLDLESQRRVLIVANPKAGATECAARVERLAELLQRDEFEVSVSQNLDEVIRDANEAFRLGELRAVVAAGGDGTVAEIVNRTPPGLPIAVFPLGTANLLANYLGVPCDPEVVCLMIAQRMLVTLDAGKAGDRIFLLMAGCGFDAQVVHQLHKQRKGHIRYWSYARPILDCIRRYEFPELRISCQYAGCEQLEDAFIARWAFVVNLPRYAGGLQFAPAASGMDGLLNVCTFRRGSLLHGLRYLGHIFAGKLDWLADCRTEVVSRVRIESDLPVPYQLDGDPGGVLPLDIEVLPGRLTLFASPAVATSIGTRATAVASS